MSENDNQLFQARSLTASLESGWRTQTILKLSLIVSPSLLAHLQTFILTCPLFAANIANIISQGILLTNAFGVTHPSEPNYVASVGGDYFGMNNDNLNSIPANVSTVVDLLESQGISWAEYQQDMPSTGYQGLQFLNPTTGANDYVRKHK